MADAVFSSKKFSVWGNRRVCSGALLLTGVHGSNGFTAAAGAFGLTKLDGVQFIPKNAAAATWQPDAVNGYILVYRVTQASTASAAHDFTSAPLIYNFIAVGE